MRQSTRTTYEDAKMALKTLLEAGYSAMFAGGCVRDRLLGITPKDFDIATSARPKQVSELFKAQHMRVIPTGIDHGTVTIMTPTGPVEITTLRRDVKTDGRHAVVDFNGASFETDAARRDFTINAMFEDDAGQIHDFHHGAQDIKDRVLRFVGAPEARIREDFLRILRYFRFWARLGFHPDEKALAAIKNEAQGLTHLSAERVTSELWGIFGAEHCADAVAAMQSTDILRVIYPHSRALNHSTFMMLNDTQNLYNDLKAWATWLLVMGFGIDSQWRHSNILDFARQRRFSERDAQTLVSLFDGWEGLISIPRSIADAFDFVDTIEQHHNHGPTLTDFFGPIWLFFARHFNDVQRLEVIGWLVAMETSLGQRRHAPPLVTGHDILEVHPELKGKAIGEILQKLRTSFRNGEWHTRSEGLETMRQLLRSSVSNDSTASKNPTDKPT